MLLDASHFDAFIHIFEFKIRFYKGNGYSYGKVRIAGSDSKNWEIDKKLCTAYFILQIKFIYLNKLVVLQSESALNIQKKIVLKID